MNPVWFDFGIAAILAAVAVTFVLGFQKWRASRSEWRMFSMLQRIGVDPSMVEEIGMEASLQTARKRCKKCQAEDVCEQWLNGKFEGGYSFCPNSQVFRSMEARHKQVLLYNS